MSNRIGHIEKMSANYSTPVDYFFNIGSEKIPLNALIGNSISLTYLNEIQCVSCGKTTSKSFAQGFCYPCFLNAPEADECILRPELCKAHLGVSRNAEWAKSHCLTEHYVYLSVTHDLKVGVTRHTQIPTRWIDQGAVKAIIIASTPNRHIAGVIETFLKKYLNDKTNWKVMLEGNIVIPDSIIDEKIRVIDLLPKTLHKYVYTPNEIYQFDYPLTNGMDKIQSVSFDKTFKISGILTGIKGQYLIFNNKEALNIRKHRGYKISFNVNAIS